MQLTTLESSAALSFSPSTRSYHSTTSASKGIVEGSARSGLACNVSFLGGSQSFHDCSQFKAIFAIPNNVTFAVFGALDEPPAPVVYAFQVDSLSRSQSLRVFVFSGAGWRTYHSCPASLVQLEASLFSP